MAFIKGRSFNKNTQRTTAGSTLRDHLVHLAHLTYEDIKIQKREKTHPEHSASGRQQQFCSAHHGS
jgi:hypothetical protein